MRRLHLLFASLLLVAGFVVTGSLVAQQPARAQDVGDLDMNVIFRCFQTDAAGIAKCDEGRSLIMANCTLCHIFVPIVLQQFDQAGWHSLIQRHRQGNRIDQLSDAQVQTIEDYLAANFNPDHDPPELPQALLENWTSY